MKIQLKKIISLFTAFLMMITILVGNGTQVYAKESSNNINVNDAIKVLSDELSKKGAALKIDQNVAIYRAGVELKDKANIVKNGIGTSSTAIGTKARQAIILMDMDENPTNYSGENYIKEIVDEINKLDEKTRFTINEIKAINTIDMYNEKYKDKKIEYSIGNAIKCVIADQNKPEKKTSFNVPQNIAWGLNVFVKHKEIEGTNYAIDKALDSLHKFQHDDSGIYLSKFSTGIHSQAVTQLVLAGQKLDSNEWTKNGKNAIDALFNSWDGKEFKDSYGSRDESAYDKALYALVTLKDAGYGDYILKNVKFDNIKKDEPETTCKVNVAVVYPLGKDKYDIKVNPKEFVISNKNQKCYGGFTALGALQAATEKYEAKGSMVNSIFGIKNQGMNGWVFTVNGKMPDTYANVTAIKDGDSVVWYYSNDGMNPKIPTLEQLNSICNDKEKPIKNGSSITQIINGVINYYNTVHFIQNQGQLVNFEYSGMYRAGADLSKKSWYLIDEYQSSYDKDLKNLASKANQSLILIEIDKDPNNYNDRHLIDEMKDEIDKNDSYFGQNEIQAVISIDKYNKKYPSKKVNYDYVHAVKKIIEAQCDDGGFKQRETSVPRNTGYALIALSSHKDIDAANASIKKAITYVHGIQKDDGGLYDKKYITGYHAEVLQGLIAAGEEPTSKEWTKASGKNSVDALLTLWKSNDSFDNAKDESINNKGWVQATWKGLQALLDLKDAGYGDYIIDGIKVSTQEKPKEELEKTCKVNVAIVVPKAGEYDSMFKPKEVTISDKQDKGFTALGALQAATKLFEMNGDMVTAIYCIESQGQNGWVYTVNGVMPDKVASKVDVKEGDKVIWYYSMNGMKGKVPSWDELTDDKQNKDLQKVINEVLGYYNGWVDNNYKSFDYITTLALRRANMDTDILNKKINIYKIESVHNDAKDIMTLIGANNNPKNYKNKDYVSKLMKNDFAKEKNPEYIAKAVIALDMAKADYDKGKLINLLLSKAHDDGNGKISCGSMQTSDDDLEEYEENLTATVWTLIALSNHKDMDKCRSTIIGIKKYLKANQEVTGLIDDNSVDTALLIQGLIALGENPLEDYWCVKRDSGKITLVDAILKCKYKNGFGRNSSSQMIIDDATSQVLAALTDLNFNSSMYRELSFKEVDRPAKLVIDGDKEINLCKGQYLDLKAKAYDANNSVIKDAAIVWKSSNDKVVTIKNATLIAVSEGQAEIIAYISGNENIKDSVKIKIGSNGCKQTVVDALNKACNSMVNFKGSENNWECATIGLSKADRQEIIPKDYLSSLEKKLKDPKNIKYYDITPLEYERMILKVLSVGGNPKNIADINLVEKVYSANLEAQNINSLVYGLISLDAGHYNIPPNAKWNRKSIIEAILDKESTNGGWSYNKGSKGNPEVTGTVLLGLSPYYSSNDNVKKAIDKAVEFLSTSQNEKGKYASYGVAMSKVSSQVITGLCANGIDPTSEKFTKKAINLIDALITFQKDNGCFIDKESTTAEATWSATEQAICALNQYKYFVEKKGSIYDFGDRNNDGIFEKQTNTIKIEGNKTIQIYKGQAIDFDAKVYDTNNVVVKNVPISWKSSNDKIACVHSKDIIAVSEGETEITAYMTDNEKVKDTIKIKVILPVKLGYDNVIKNEIDFLKEHYKSYRSYEFLASPAAAIAGMDKDEIGSNILRYSSNDVGIYNARVIVALLGAGLDPRNDVVKGTKNNYVEILEKAQKTEGKDKGKFSINEFADSDCITTQAYSIIALDLAGGKYDEQSAVKAVLEMLNDKNYKNSPSYHSLKTEAAALMALAKHKDVGGVQTKIDELLKFIKSNQNKDGGFDIVAGSTFSNSPVATGAVVTALYTLGIDPMSAEWTKDGNTVIDSLVRNKVVKNDPAIGGYAQGEDLYFENYEATYYAFTALVELLNKKSIFDILGNSIDSHKVPVSGVSMDKKVLELNIGDSIKLNGNITPENASNKNIEWTSSNKEVAFVDNNGNITGIKEGKAVIKVKTQDGDKTAECGVTVRAKKTDETVKTLKVENITTENEFKNGSQAKLQFKISNYQDETKNSTLIVRLFDKDGKLVDYVIAEQKIESGNDVILTGAINIPKIGEYKLNAFVSDSIEGLVPLSDVLEFDVK